MRKFIGFAASLALSIAAAPIAPAAAQSTGSAQRQFTQLCDNNPGSCLVYRGCEATASNEYDRTGRSGDALGVLVVCGGTLCALTGDYGNCVRVISRLFLLRLQ